MADVLVLGAGLNGLSTAMLLASDGHGVTVLERDDEPPPDEPEKAWAAWDRAGVNQFRLPHYMLPRWRRLMDRELPGVLAELVAVGAVTFNPLAQMAERHTGGWWPGDERFATITARRPVLEAVLARCAAEAPGVTIRRGTSARAVLLAAQTRPSLPHVTGIVTERGEDVLADAVIDCTGRRSPLPALLAAAGAPAPVEHREDSGFVYYSRQFRASGAGRPKVLAALVQDYESLSLLTLPADNDTWSVSFVVGARDRELRALRDPVVWARVLGEFRLAAHWANGEPISEVTVMAGTEDRIRCYQRDGQPTVTGLLAVGDAWACTNPSLGRGASIGLLHACALRDLLREGDPDRPEELARRWGESTRADVEPLYQLTRDYDRHRLAQIEANRKGRPYRSADPGWAGITALAAAARRHPEALRGVLDIASLLATPQEVLARPGIAEHLPAEHLPTEHLPAGPPPSTDPEAIPSQVLPGPDRQRLLAVLSA